MEVVLDASVALAWALPDENSEVAESLLATKEDEMIFCVPPLWWYEVTNALLVAVRRKRLKDDDRIKIIELYESLPIFTDTEINEKTMGRIFVTANVYNLTAYDASYLELAKRKKIGLATVDKNLFRAAKKAQVELVIS